MCGEFTWEKGWSIEKDETLRFLQLTSFMCSNNWERFCSNHQGCKGENDIDWHKVLNGLRAEGDPKIPSSLKHPFKHCKKHHPVNHKGHGEKDYTPFNELFAQVKAPVCNLEPCE